MTKAQLDSFFSAGLFCIGLIARTAPGVCMLSGSGTAGGVCGMWSIVSGCLLVGGDGGYSKIIKPCNSVLTAFSVPFESLRIHKQETGWCSFGVFREVCAWGIPQFKPL